MRRVQRGIAVITFCLCMTIGWGQTLLTVPPRYGHLLYLPKKTWSGKKWPLILYLHGKSLRGHDLSRVSRYGLAKRLLTDKGFPFIVVSPQLPDGQRWTDTKAMASLVNSIIRWYPVDRQRVYAMGFSMGASGVWRVANDYPQMFAAIVSVGGMYERPVAASPKLKSVAIWSIHGLNDKEASPTEAKEALDLHRKAGGEGIFTALPGEGHSIPQVFERSDLYKWLIKHRISGRS